MKMKMLCTMLLGSAAVLACTTVRAQTNPESDKKFIAKASESDLAEIKLSQLALQKSSDPQIKDFAQKMIDDHTKLEQKMKPFADKMGVPPADTLNDKHQAEYDKLNALSGAAFDKEYTQAMDMDHHLALMAFDAEINTTTMSATSDFILTVTDGEKTVAMHTKMADKMEKEMGLPAIDPTSL